MAGPDDAKGFTLGVRYLTGYAVAALPTGEPEWPPHPARLFMALVAACHETGGESGGESGGDPEELAALRWVETLGPPAMLASDSDERLPVTTYVPPNDFTAKDPNILPQWRTKKQPRTFPRVRPHHDVVYFVWPDAPQHESALDALCEKVTRLGHSASLVQVWYQRGGPERDGEPGEPGEPGDPGGPGGPGGHSGLHDYRPSARGTHRLRTVNAGTLDYLDQAYRADDIAAHFTMNTAITSAPRNSPARRQLEADYEARLDRPWTKNVAAPERLRPELSTAVAYERVGDATAGVTGCFDTSLVVLSLSPQQGLSRFRRLDAVSAPWACEVFRRAIQHHAPDDLALVHGHAADGAPMRAPHLAVFPLLSVGHPHSDGHLMAVAATLPREGDARDRALALKAIQRVDHLALGTLGKWDATLVAFEDVRKTLLPPVWTASPRGSTRWATVTPIALDRHSKAKDPAAQQDEVAEQVRLACEAIGLPRPRHVVPYPVSVFPGLPDAGRYPRLARKDGSKRRQTHAVIWFDEDEPVIGPVLLGAGRFRGWGLCRPYPEGNKP